MKILTTEFLDKMKEDAEQAARGSYGYVEDFIEQYDKIIRHIHKLINEKDKEINELRKLNNELISKEYWKPTKNERGAGRKSKITAKLCEDIKYRKQQGETYKVIAEALNLSVGLVHKAFNTDIHILNNEHNS